MYDSGRYFTITGKHLSGTPLSIQNRQQILDDVAAEVFPPESKWCHVAQVASPMFQTKN